jgi:hypothetical protein
MTRTPKESSADQRSTTPPDRRLLSGFRSLPPEQKLSVYNASVVTVGAVLALIAWFPDFRAKQQTVSEFSIVRDNPTGILRTRDIGTLPDGRHRYDISYELILKNASNRPFKVELSIDRLFLGHNHYDPANGVAQEIEDPPSIWDKTDRKATDVADWELLASSVGVGDDPDKDLIKRLKEYGIISNKPGHPSDVDVNGGMAGLYVPDHITGYVAHYILAAQPTDYAAIEITYGVKPRLSVWEKLFGTDQSSFFGANPNWEVVWLQDATNSSCKFGVRTQDGKTSSDCPGGDEATAVTNAK